MLKKKYQLMSYLLAAFFLSPIFSGNAFAQARDHTVEGQVIDANTEEELVGVNILVEGTTIGTTSDSDGNFRLETAPDDTLTFSYIGYQSLEVPIEGRSTITVEMMDESIVGDEVVFIGYGTRQVEDNTGSIGRVTADQFNPGTTSPGELFQGRIPGVDVTSSDGAPGSGPAIRIRGGSSLSASNDPLFVIDGVPIAPGGISGMRDPLNSINPNDIEDITVLKDASATAIYGSRASNGVIVITTKQGQAGQPLQLNYESKLRYETQRETIGVLEPDEFRQVIDEQFGERGTEKLGDHETDWQDQIYSNVFSHEHNISLSGALREVPFHASLGFTGDEGILNTSSNDRLAGSLRLTPRFLDDNLQVDLNLRGSRVDNRFANTEAVNTAIAFDPTQPVMDEDSDFGGYFAWTDADGQPIDIAPANPVALLEQTRDESTVYRSVGNLQLDYRMPFLQDLTATLNLGYDYSDVSDGTNFVTDDAAFDFEGDAFSGSRTEYDQRRENQLLDFYLNYETELPELRSNFDATAGYSWEHNYEEGSTYTTNYNIDDTVVVHTDTDYKTENYLVSFFGRANYTLMDRYSLTATMRADGSSRFAEDNRWGYFPSMAFAWNLHREPFMEDFGRLSSLRLRIGYGVTGQQEILQGNFPYLARYTFGETSAQYRFGDEFLRTYRPEGYNLDLQWEETTTYNIALDYGFYDNRIRGTLEAYHRETDNLLNVVPVAAGTNFTNRIISNVGDLEVQGIEFDITGVPVATRDAYWEVSFNVSHNVNEITRLTTVDDPGYIGVETGDIAGGTGNTIQIHSVGHPRSSFYVYEQVYDEDGSPVEGAYVDRTGDGRITEDDLYRLGSPDPDVTFGLSSRFQYQNWDFSFAARAQVGNYVYNNVDSEYGFYSMMLYNQYLRNSPSSITETDFVDPRFHSDHYVEDASFLRMDNITVGYTFENLFDVVPSMRVSGTVNNAFVITNYSGLDPEVFGGIDNQVYPRPRTWIMSVNIDF